jgi:glucose-6-phosphate 1-dehydrogenase
MNATAPRSATPLSLVIVGASGDLARKKVIPALFSLYCQDLLPEPFHLFGLARTAYDHAAFRAAVAEHLTCRYAPGASCGARMDDFLARCYYQAGRYDAADSFLDLYELMRAVQGTGRANRMFYMAVPPSVFLDVACALGGAGLVACGESAEWSRVVVEKPFGRDRATSDALVREMNRVFVEDATFRIDHYLGKEVVQNLMVLRFANRIFEPLWSGEHIESVRITWKETDAVGQRGGYFDQFGIIRDVMQNHLLQILALTAMEPPAALDSHAVRNAKVALLSAMPPLAPENLIVGQYVAAPGATAGPGYVEEPGVPRDSCTPTYASAVLEIRNDRWRGVPFMIAAGKAVDRRVNEIRVRFRAPARSLFGAAHGGVLADEMVIRVQPDEALDLRIMNKVPGLRMLLRQTDLNLRYQAAFDAAIPDAYECLLLDVLRGDRSLFIRADELAAAWDVFTPALHALEAERVRPEPYVRGSRGPAGAAALAARRGVPAEE